MLQFIVHYLNQCILVVTLIEKIVAEQTFLVPFFPEAKKVLQI